MKHLDLFSGIGGFSYAADQVWENVEHIFCENDPFCQEVLKKHWPEARIFGDIRTLTKEDVVADATDGWWREPSRERRRGTSSTRLGDKTPGSIYLLTGGFPCQPFSQAGRRKGTQDDRHLWPEMAWVIREFKPEWVVAENVAGLLTINNGVVFETVCTDLEAEGYEVQAFVIPACAVGAPHRRDRVWIVAHRNEGGLEKKRAELKTAGSRGSDTNAQNTIGKRSGGRMENKRQILERQSTEAENARSDSESYAPNPECAGHEGQKPEAGQDARCYRGPRPQRWDENWLEVATWYGRVYDGVQEWMDGCFAGIITPKEYGSLTKSNKAEVLSALWQAVQQTEVREELSRRYPLGQAEILFAFLRGIKEGSYQQKFVPHQGEKTLEEKMRVMRDGNEARCSPRRQKLQEQLADELAHFMPSVPHETSLESEAEKRTSKVLVVRKTSERSGVMPKTLFSPTEAWRSNEGTDREAIIREVARVWDILWLAYSSMKSVSSLDGRMTPAKHRAERLKALGNAIVPQVAVEIFKAIRAMN